MKPLFLFVGKSGSGKSFVTNCLEETYNYKSLQSYTTRKPRYDNEIGHIFVTDEEFDTLKDIIAYTEYNGFRYCGTESQLDESNCYVIDVPGVEFLLEKYTNVERPIRIVYLDTNIRTRIDRMVARGDSDTKVLGRIYNDEEYDWYNRLHKSVWNYKNNLHRDIVLYTIDANRNQLEVIEQVIKVVEEK